MVIKVISMLFKAVISLNIPSHIHTRHPIAFDAGALEMSKSVRLQFRSFWVPLVPAILFGENLSRMSGMTYNVPEVLRTLCIALDSYQTTH